MSRIQDQSALSNTSEIVFGKRLSGKSTFARHRGSQTGQVVYDDLEEKNQELKEGIYVVSCLNMVRKLVSELPVQRVYIPVSDRANVKRYTDWIAKLGNRVDVLKNSGTRSSGYDFIYFQVAPQ